MKIIISHDIDHLSVKEHIFKDLIIPKYICWSILELVKRKISFKIFLNKITGLLRKNNWNNLEKLSEFDKKKGVNPTFFVGVNNDKGLSYSLKQVKEAINLIKKYNFDIGVHGICYNNHMGIKKEFETFKKISGLEKFGIRIHYLKQNANTLKNLAKAGYLFDSTVFSKKLAQEYRINRLIEIPFHIMDSSLLGIKANLNLDQTKEKTIKLLEEAEMSNKKYFAILFHQRHFSKDFPHFKNWYIWLINHCEKKKYEFVNYKHLCQSSYQY